MTGGIIGLFIIDFRMTVLVLLFIPIKCVVMKYFAKAKQIMDEFIKGIRSTQNGLEILLEGTRSQAV